jgi:protein-tyrosine kinase
MENMSNKLKHSISIGTLLVNAGKISASDTEQIIAIQQQKGVRFGVVAKELGLVSEDDIQVALSYQFDFPNLKDIDREFNQELVAAYKPYCAYVEELRAVRNQLLLRWFDKNTSLAIVSPERMEGRSALVANLAIVFTQLGKKTLVVDADFRQPRQQVLFNIIGKYGLSDILAERSSLEIIHTIENYSNLSILIAGTNPPNPIELLSKNFKKLILELQTQYDVILIDTPAMVDGIDLQIISAYCGGAMLVTRQNETRLTNMQHLKDALIETGSYCVGAIISSF